MPQLLLDPISTDFTADDDYCRNDGNTWNRHGKRRKNSHRRKESQCPSAQKPEAQNYRDSFLGLIQRHPLVGEVGFGVVWDVHFFDVFTVTWFSSNHPRPTKGIFVAITVIN